MFSRARGLAVQHSSFIVAQSCCCRRCRCATRYESAGRSRPRPCRRHSSSSLPVLLSSPSRDAMYMPRALALRISSSTYVVVAAVINSSCACARWLMDIACAHAHEGFVVNILCHRCVLAHDGILLAQSCAVDVDNNTQCERKLVLLHMRGLTPTYDVVAAVVSSPLLSRVGQYTITKLVRSRTIGLYE